jgi:predicted PurR-regulated permease PerM
LLEGHKLPETIVEFLPRRHRAEAKRVIREMDSALSSYIQGVIIVSLTVAGMAFIGYSIIGIDYALLLALVAGVTNVIPFFGPIIGTIPGMFVALSYSPATVFKVVLMIIIIQQIESLLLSPRVMGRKMNTHPVTIILLVIAAGKLAGLLGILLAIPTFAVAKVVLSHLYSLYRIYADKEDIVEHGHKDVRAGEPV